MNCTDMKANTAPMSTTAIILNPATEEVVRTVELASVEDTDAHYASSVAVGARIVCEPVDRSYGIKGIWRGRP